MTTRKTTKGKAKSKMTRHGALKLTAASAAQPLVHIRSGRAAEKLSIAFWDHWVPSCNVMMQKQVAIDQAIAWSDDELEGFAR